MESDGWDHNPSQKARSPSNGHLHRIKIGMALGYVDSLSKLITCHLIVFLCQPRRC